MKTVCEKLIDTLNTAGKTVKYLRCDNMGENVTPLKEVCNSKNIQLELTTPYTPQMNGVVERGFITTRDMGLAFLLSAKLNQEHQKMLWAEAMNAATDISNLLLTSVNDKSPQELMTGQKSKIYKQLVQWGRLGYVTKWDKIKKKLDEKSFKCMLIG